MRRIFLAPGVIFAVSLFGLVAALLGDGLWDFAGWAGLALPVAAIAWGWRRRT